MTLEGRYLSLLKAIDTDGSQATACDTGCGLRSTHPPRQPTLSGVEHKMTQIQKHNTSNTQCLFIDLHEYSGRGRGREVHDEMLFSGR